MIWGDDACNGPCLSAPMHSSCQSSGGKILPGFRTWPEHFICVDLVVHVDHSVCQGLSVSFHSLHSTVSTVYVCVYFILCSSMSLNECFHSALSFRHLQLWYTLVLCPPHARLLVRGWGLGTRQTSNKSCDRDYTCVLASVLGHTHMQTIVWQNHITTYQPYPSSLPIIDSLPIVCML